MDSELIYAWRRLEKGGGFQKRLRVVSKDRVRDFELEVSSLPHPIPNRETTVESAIYRYISTHTHTHTRAQTLADHKDFINQFQAHPKHPVQIQTITRKSALAKWAKRQKEPQTWI